ncbi:hypothetical protein J1N35_025424 [Gossypium stocksii]|uniref:Uncharacterized protein n=1 Tax=Gossypium stocksii TaxID=47602 RepID=A0A9D3ZXN0_9ROSI|nr:hypothetical protein J1N35_025424 [Gossypium stocksii]
MKESGGVDGFEGEKISLLAEELIQLSVKSSTIIPSEKPTLLCSIWIKKSYNPDSFRAHMKRHSLQDCIELTPAEKSKIRDNPPFSLALKTELNLIGRESLKFNAISKKMDPQCSYVESEKELELLKGESAVEEKVNGEQENNADFSKPAKKSSWKRLESVKLVDHQSRDSLLRKRKLTYVETGDICTRKIDEDAAKRLKHDRRDLLIEKDTNLSAENFQIVNPPNQNRSAAANRQADRAQ